MSQSPSGDSSAPSPSKATSSTGGSAFKSKIAAFESGLAANASRRDQSKQIPHADLSNLRSRFDREGEKPLEVKGSFGLGAAPPRGSTGGGIGGHASGASARAVSLGIGRAASPLESPSKVNAPGAASQGISGVGRNFSSNASTTPTAGNPSGNAEFSSNTRLPTSASIPSSSSKPMITRSDSAGSNSTSATSTSISGLTATSTASSLLPGPLAALRGSTSTGTSTSLYAGDDSMSAGLRTPMSSVSLSSMRVEAGSTIGDAASSAGDTTANELEEEAEEYESVTTPHDEKVESAEAKTPEPSQQQQQQQQIQGQSVELSAAALEKKKETEEGEGIPAHPAHLNLHGSGKRTESVISIDSQQPPQDAVERAAEELGKYTLEEPSTTAVISPPLPQEASSFPRSISATQLAVPGTEDATDSSLPAGSSDLPISPPASVRRSPLKRHSSHSPKDRLKRSSTTNSIASHPESDLADTNLESFDAQDDTAKAKAVADDMLPEPASGAQAGSDAPLASPTRLVVTEDTDPADVGQNDLSSQDAHDFAPLSTNAEGEAEDVDADGMPLVKCSDCGAKVSLVQLGEHVCAASALTPSASKVEFPSSISNNSLSVSTGDSSFGRDRRETGPEDVPQGVMSPDIFPSPQLSHRSLASSRPDVPDDEAMSVASMPTGLDDKLESDNQPVASARRGLAQMDLEAGPFPTDAEDGEEEYMTAFTSRRDSSDASSNARPDFMSNLPESISDPRLFGNGLGRGNEYSNDDDEETEELALGMAELAANTPRMRSFANGSNNDQMDVPRSHPDSPTPDKGHNSPTTVLSPTTPRDQKMSGSYSPALQPQTGLVGATGVRRRSSAGKRNKALGDTDSEGEMEPGTVTIIR